MDAIVISLLVVAAIVVALGIAIGVRRHRSNDYASQLSTRDQPHHSEEVRLAEAARHVDRSGSGAGGGF
ncbi:hypothetical protein VD659_06670 [Herbiconiux sp. 11R-BC]|uniref:hypothetical protein n=1 Tax=Herbiconiux sp. 11R-BC TaxID=3111637 RepID=UPI003BFABFE8